MVAIATENILNSLMKVRYVLKDFEVSCGSTTWEPHPRNGFGWFYKCRGKQREIDTTSFHSNSYFSITNYLFSVSNRIREHDTVHEEIHDSNTVHGRLGPGYVLHWRPAFPWSVAVGRKELCYLQMGQREQVYKGFKTFSLLQVLTFLQ